MKADKNMETQEHIESYQNLFNHMADEHGLTLLQSEMDEIIRLSKEVVIKYDSISDVSKTELCGKSKCNRQKLDGNI